MQARIIHNDQAKVFKEEIESLKKLDNHSVIWGYGLGFNTIANIKEGKIGSFYSKNEESIKYVDYQIDQLEF